MTYLFIKARHAAQCLNYLVCERSGYDDDDNNNKTV